MKPVKHDMLKNIKLKTKNKFKKFNFFTISDFLVNVRMLLMRCLPHLKESPLGGQEQLGKRKNLVNDQEEFASAA